MYINGQLNQLTMIFIENSLQIVYIKELSAPEGYYVDIKKFI